LIFFTVLPHHGYFNELNIMWSFRQSIRKVSMNLKSIGYSFGFTEHPSFCLSAYKFNQKRITSELTIHGLLKRNNIIQTGNAASGEFGFKKADPHANPFDFHRLLVRILPMSFCWIRCIEKSNENKGNLPVRSIFQTKYVKQ